MKKRNLSILLILLTIAFAACSGNNLTDVSQLEDQTWVLTSYNVTQPVDGHQPTLEFDADQISGTTGCNHYGGTYQIEGDTIHFKGVFNTEMACLEPEGLMDQERIYLELLQSADHFEFIDGTLTLYAEANPILVFVEGQ